MTLAAAAASTFGTLARARQAAVAAGRAYDLASDACECRTKGCACSVAWRAYQDAQDVVSERLAAYREIHDLRKEERGF